MYLFIGYDKEISYIKGIVIGDYEHKLSQFADDTSIFCDWTLESLEAALNTIEMFCIFSGLKMNCDKTKVIWIGSKNIHKINSIFLCFGRNNF